MLAIATRSAALFCVLLSVLFSGLPSAYALIVDVDGKPFSSVELKPPAPKVAGQCESLFKPGSSTRALQTFDHSVREFPAAAKVTEETPLPNIIIADQIGIYSPSDVAKAAADTNISKELRATYEKMMARGPERFVVKPRSLDVLNPLYETFPNFKHVLDYVKKSLALAIASSQPTYFPPIILLGDPGIGKTHFANALAEALGTGFDLVPMNSMTAGWVLSGASSQWKDARMGKVAKALIEGETANPIFVLDEIDKASGAENYNPLGSLYTLWERKTAKMHKDEFLEIPVDTSFVIWVATANYVEAINEAILSRATVFKVEKPTVAQMHFVVANIMKQALAEFPKLKFSNRISEEVFQKLAKFTPRDARKLVNDGIGNAVLNNRRELESNDINPEILKAANAKNGIGFTQ